MRMTWMGYTAGMATNTPVTRPPLAAVNRRQMVMRPIDVERLIEEDHPARSIWELVGRLDLSRYYAEIGSVEGRAGREHTDPQVLISLWLYANSRGISSAREMARRCEYEPAFQWLGGEWCQEPFCHRGKRIGCEYGRSGGTVSGTISGSEWTSCRYCRYRKLGSFSC